MKQKSCCPPLLAGLIGFILGAVAVKLADRFCPLCRGGSCCCSAGEECCCGEHGEDECCCAGHGEGEAGASDPGVAEAPAEG